MRSSGNGRSQGQGGAWGAGEASQLESVVGSVGDEVAYARARFAVDPSTPARLADAWTAPAGATEEDESELIDAVADCLSVGLPLDAAVASWRSGALLVVSDRDDEDDETGLYEEDDRTDVYDPPPPGHRRRIVET